MKDDNLAITTIEESSNSIAQLVEYFHKLEHISTHTAKKKKDEWTCGYDGIWMNGKNNNTFQALRDVNYFHVDIQKKIHHELNGVLEKNDYLIQKWLVALKGKT
jgi:hypothetical protein